MTTLSDDGSCPPSAATRAAIAAVTTAQREAPATALASNGNGRHLQKVHVFLSIRLSPCSESENEILRKVPYSRSVGQFRLLGSVSFVISTNLQTRFDLDLQNEA
jgi:hypothetical protein